MAKFDDKISTLINTQLPDFVIDDHPKFAQFLKTYYQFMESAELQVTSIESTDGITLENETGTTKNLTLNGSKLGAEKTQLDKDDKILLEETVFGKFTFGETITGQTSGATATILAEDLANERVFVSSQNKFIVGETILGSSSNAQAVINAYRPNPVNSIQKLTNFRDPDNVISDFLTKFREEFLQTLPDQLAVGLDKRKLIKNIKSMYRLKGTSKGNEIFFRMLFNEESETFYPRVNMLRVSDGQWDTQRVLRAIVVANTGDTTELTGRQITGETSGATAVVESVTKTIVGSTEISELVINKEYEEGTFQIGEIIRGTSSDDDDYFIKATITGIPGNKNITNDGSLYSTSDLISVDGGGNGATIVIDDIGTGGINEIIVSNAGSNYTIGDSLSFTNTGTEGSGAAGFVSVVNGGISPDRGTPDTTGDDHIILENATTRGDQYFGRKIVQESDTGSGDITDFFITNEGSGYKSLPTVSVTSSTGSNAKVLAFGNDVGRVLGLKTIELGSGYENSPTPPTLTFFKNVVIKSLTGTFLKDETITFSGGATGTAVSFDTDTQLLKLKNVTGTIATGETLFNNTSSGEATVAKIDLATATVDVVATTDTDGRFLNEDGHISESTMKVQDSLYYQDFSYVLKVGQSINRWRDAYKKTMHTSGFYFTGQVDLVNRINMQVRSPVAGIVSGSSDTPLFEVLNILFTTLFGRRLGTVDDGTSLRSNANEPADADLNPDTIEHFGTNTRDITLTRPSIEIDYLSRVRRTIDGVEVKTGFAYAGPRFGTINKFANTAFGVNNPGSKITFKTLNDILVEGTRSTLNGRNGIFLMTSNEDGKLLKTNFALPAVVAESKESFDNTVTNFAQTSITFDDATP